MSGVRDPDNQPDDLHTDADGNLKTTDAGGAATATGIGAPADTAATTDTGAFSLIALVKRLLQGTTSGNAAIGAAADAAATSDTGTFSLISLIKRLAADSPRATSNLTRTIVSNAAASGETVAVAAVALQTTRIHRLRVHADGACVVTFKNAGGVNVLEPMIFANAGEHVVLDFSKDPYGVTAVNTVLAMDVSAAVQVYAMVESITSA